jgi:hypothetical protein
MTCEWTACRSPLRSMSPRHTQEKTVPSEEEAGLRCSPSLRLVLRPSFELVDEATFRHLHNWYSTNFETGISFVAHGTNRYARSDCVAFWAQHLMALLLLAILKCARSAEKLGLRKKPKYRWSTARYISNSPCITCTAADTLACCSQRCGCWRGQPLDTSLLPRLLPQLRPALTLS